MKAAIRILVIDDELSVRDSLYNWFREEGYMVDVAASAKECLTKLADQEWDIFLIDIKMPGIDGLELQRRIKKIYPESTIIIMTAYASIESAVEALKQGAYDYISKPFDPDDLSHLIRNAAERKQLVVETAQLRKKLDEVSSAQEIVGQNLGMRKILELVNIVSGTDATVLIRGESGTGKELIAKAVHANSRRRYMPIVTVNCGALSEGVLESELFGHEKGAFTGAQYSRKGKFEMADGGTIFLDEIGDISPKTQIDLLRVLEEKKFFRVGGNREIRVDFRTIAATNKDLNAAMEQGIFRKDLYYRLNVFTIEIPPLRERPEDIPLLAEHFLREYARSMNKPVSTISPAAMEVLRGYSWPGNVRELENAVERAVVVCKGGEIQASDFPLTNDSNIGFSDGKSLADMERYYIKNVLDQTDWNIAKTARILEIDRVTLYNKIKKYNLKH
jgi:DNA-binding NtrC family response regulator